VALTRAHRVRAEADERIAARARLITGNRAAISGRVRPGVIYLADKSAWEQVRYNEAVRERFAKLQTTCQLAIHTVVAAELLFSARTYDAFLARREECDGLRWLDTPPEAETRALDVMQVFARQGRHRSVGIPDLLIAAVAEVHGATVLHYDSDFERIAEITGQAHEWIVPCGQGHGHAGDDRLDNGRETSQR
jgi:predicted nucleic acid-binding protein